ncbi:MAG TPA: glycoside hydrolase family 3 C-terminal domain-containing protein, partial [Polyangiaceae bacterium]|nr:glycoside hydrolase family 3 C-terminal domain-containing protein [Polyangiaceae bacterium]
MAKATRKVGRAVASIVALVAGCAPMSINLEHQGTGGDGAGETNTSGTGGSSLGTSGGAHQGSAGRGGSGGTGAPSGGTGDSASSDAGQGTGNDGNGGPSCGNGVLADVQNGHDLLPGYTAPQDPRVATWLAEMTLEDQMTEMQGANDGHDKNFNDIQRSLDVPLADGTVLRGYKYCGGPRGATLAQPQLDRSSDGNNFSTAFPAPSIRGASWDLDLEWRVGEAIGDETTASNNDLLLGPGVDVLRHPYWGRSQDTYGEDTYHLGRMGTAFVAGVQQRIGACAQHFVQDTIESNRSNNNPMVDEQTLREIYARPFEMLVKDGGVACVMAAYGMLNGVRTTANAHLLTDILKGPVEQGGFGFRGLVLTDWWAAPGGEVGRIDAQTGTANATAMANAGLDVELPWWLNYGYLPNVVPASVDPDVIAGAASRVLEQKARFQSALTSEPIGLRPSSSALEGSSIATNGEHLTLAERAELESAVLLANGLDGAPVLPIAEQTRTITVIGAEVDFILQSTTNPRSCPTTKGNCTFHFATDVALGDRGSNRVNADPAVSVGPFSGIQAASTTRGITTVTEGSTAQDAAASEVVVVVVGLTPGDEGEEYALTTGGDRRTLALPASQAELVSSVLDLNKPTVIVVESGSMVELPWLTHTNRNQATVCAGYGGMRGGAALGKLLFGDANFSGKLPVAWAHESALPPFDDGSMGYFVGYREYDRRAAAGDQVGVVFPFGHGLSYTTFAYSDLGVPCTDVSERAVLDVTANVTNTGAFDGDEVAFLFVAGPTGSDEPRSVKELKSFARVSLAAGAAQTVHLPVRVQDLRHWSNAQNLWVIDPGEYRVLVG